jgi:signal transduction histidine kinase
MSSAVGLRSVRVRLPAAVSDYIAPAAVAVAYYVGAQAAFAIGTLSDRIFAPFWPPNIILFCALLLVPRRKWWIYLLAAFPAHFIAEVSVGMPPAQNLVAFGTNCLVAILNAVGVRWLLKGPPWFGTLASAAGYIMVTTAVSPALVAFAGAFVQVLGGGSMTNYWNFWLNWYLSNALASVTLGPVLLIWSGQRIDLALAGMTSRRKTEALMLVLSLSIICGLAFHQSSKSISTGFLPAVMYSPLPLILWAAIRFGDRGAGGAILVVTVVSIWQSLHESTVFIGLNPEASVLALQVFLICIAIPVFFLGAAIDELQRTGEATRELAGALLRSQDEERRRIARELHDSTGQNLVVAGLMAERVQGMVPKTCAPVVGELREILQRSIMEIRTVSYLLHPPLLDGVGLNVALRSYVEGFSKRTGIGVELDLELPANIGRMSSGVELVLFRVIQEALTNVWRHSGSSSARIRLARRANEVTDQVTLTIEDSGKGIPKNIRLSALSNRKGRNHIPSGLGLAGMRERLHQIGGNLEIDSMTGKTIIRAIVDLHPKANQVS